MNQVREVGEFARRIDMLRSIWPISVTSWFRSGDRNYKVGGLDISWHRLGLAVDVIFDEDFYVNQGEWLNDVTRLGLEAVDEGDHWHIEVRG